MKLFVIVLHFGDPELTKKCLTTVIKKIRFDQLLVVNNSTKEFPIKSKNFKIIKTGKNLGYAGGMNVGINHALSKGATHVLLLNNDILLENDFLTSLVKVFDDNKNAGIVGPAIKFKKNNKTIYDLGGEVNMISGRTRHYEVGKILNNSFRLVDYISGCCMLIKREVFEKIGFFDEKFFLYYEDVDFCLRAKKAGFLIFVSPIVFISHKLSSSVGKSSNLAAYHQTISGLYFGEKHLGKYRIFNFLFIFLQSFFLGRYAFFGFFNYLRGSK